MVSGTNRTKGTEARRDDAAQLIAVAIGMLDEEREQIVRDYLHHALGALDRVRAADRDGGSAR